MDDRLLDGMSGQKSPGKSDSSSATYDLRCFLDEIADGLFIADGTGTLKYANLPLARILDSPKVCALIGHRLSEFSDPSFKKVLRETYEKAAKADNETFRTAIGIRRSDNTKAWIEVRVKKASKELAELSFSGIVRDITEQRLALEALKANEALYQSIVEMSPDAIITTRLDGKISTANSQALRLLGYENLDSFVGRTAFDFVFLEERDRAKKEFGSVAVSGKLQNREYPMIRKDGTSFWAELSASLIPEMEGKPAELLLTARDISKRKSMEENLRNLSVTDELTGLYNRRGFAFAAEQELKHAHRTKKEMALLFFDMDRLKMINDTYGHDEGDEALKAAAAAFHSTFRESDIIGRWGGDEFVVLALDVPAGSVSALQRRLEENLTRRNNAEGTRCILSFSTGIARYDPENPMSLHELVKVADGLMYEGKQKKHI